MKYKYDIIRIVSGICFFAGTKTYITNNNPMIATTFLVVAFLGLYVFVEAIIQEDK